MRSFIRIVFMDGMNDSQIRLRILLCLVALLIWTTQTTEFMIVVIDRMTVSCFIVSKQLIQSTNHLSSFSYTIAAFLCLSRNQLTLFFLPPQVIRYSHVQGISKDVKTNELIRNQFMWLKIAGNQITIDKWFYFRFLCY